MRVDGGRGRSCFHHIASNYRRRRVLFLRVSPSRRGLGGRVVDLCLPHLEAWGGGRPRQVFQLRRLYFGPPSSTLSHSNPPTIHHGSQSMCLSCLWRSWHSEGRGVASPSLGRRFFFFFFFFFFFPLSPLASRPSPYLPASSTSSISSRLHPHHTLCALLLVQPPAHLPALPGGGALDVRVFRPRSSLHGPPVQDPATAGPQETCRA